MTVYVDDARIPYGRMLMAHLVADDADELHALAGAIGIRRRYYHRGHYNICQVKRAAAVAAGARAVTRREAARIRRQLERQA